LNMLRLFIAVEIESEECKNLLISLQKALPSATVKKVQLNQIHMTLKFLGDTDEKKLPELTAALDQISFSKFSMQFMELGAFPNRKRPNVFWISVSDGKVELLRLAESVSSGLSSLGIPKEDRGFHPHLTLARAKHFGTGLLRDYGGFFDQTFDDPQLFRTSITKFVLKSSILTPQGPIYDDLYTKHALDS